MHVCVGANVWQILVHMEGPRDIPWAVANPSEGCSLCTRPAWTLARIRLRDAKVPGKPALAMAGALGLIISHPRGNSNWRDCTP